MNKIKRYFYFKIISVVVIISFLTFDIVWAYSDNLASPDTLAFEVMSQPQMMGPDLTVFKESMISDVNILGTTFSVARYLLGDVEEGETSLPLEHMSAVISDELGDVAENIDLTRVTLEEGIVTIPVKKNGQKFIVQVALKNSISAKGLSGDEWTISEKYVVSITREGKSAEDQEVIDRGKEKVTVPKTVAEIDLEKEFSSKGEDNTTPGTQKDGHHDFKSISGIKAGFVTMALSLASLTATSLLYFSQGYFTGLSGITASIGIYFTWATLRYFSLGIKVYRVLVKSGVSPKEAWQEIVARGVLYRHKAFAKLSGKSRNLIMIHEGFKTHLGGIIGILPIVNWVGSRTLTTVYANLVDREQASLWAEGEGILEMKDIIDLSAILKELRKENKFFSAKVELLYEQLFAIGTKKALTVVRNDIARFLIKDILKGHGMRGEIPSDIMINLLSFVTEMRDIVTIDKIIGNHVIVKKESYDDYRFKRIGYEKVDNNDFSYKYGGTYTKTPIYKKISVKRTMKTLIVDIPKLSRLSKNQNALEDVFKKKKEKGRIRSIVSKIFEEYINGALSKSGVSGKKTKIPNYECEIIITALSELIEERGKEIKEEEEISSLVLNILDRSIKINSEKDEWTREEGYYGETNSGISGIGGSFMSWDSSLRESREWVVTKPSVKIPGYCVMTADIEKMKRMIREMTEGKIEKKDDAAMAEDIILVETPMDIIETEVNNRRARIDEAISEIVATGSGIKSSLDKVSAKESTVAVREMAEEILRKAKDLTEAEVNALPEKTILAVKSLEESVDSLEADTVVASLIRLSRAAKREGQKVIVGFETDWMPGYKKGKLQYNAVNPLVKEIGRLEKKLHSLGLTNVIFEHKKSEELAGFLLTEAKKSSTNLSNIVALASEETIGSQSFEFFREVQGEDKPLLAAVNAAELQLFYSEKGGDSIEAQLVVGLFEMLAFVLEFSSGKELSEIPMNGIYFKEQRKIVFYPDADTLSYSELVDLNEGRIRALKSA